MPGSRLLPRRPWIDASGRFDFWTEFESGAERSASEISSKSAHPVRLSRSRSRSTTCRPEENAFGARCRIEHPHETPICWISLVHDPDGTKSGCISQAALPMPWRRAVPGRARRPVNRFARHDVTSSRTSSGRHSTASPRWGSGVATVHEALGRTGLLASYLRPIYHERRSSGTVTVTVAPGDNTMIHVAVDCAAKAMCLWSSDVAVRRRYFGDLFGGAQRPRRARRDHRGRLPRRSQPREMGFPVWSKAVFAQARQEKLARQPPLVCAGQRVSPRRDPRDDDACWSCRARIDEACAASAARIEKEARNRLRFAAGEVGLDVYGCASGSSPRLDDYDDAAAYASRKST